MRVDIRHIWRLDLNPKLKTMQLSQNLICVIQNTSNYANSIEQFLKQTFGKTKRTSIHKTKQPQQFYSSKQLSPTWYFGGSYNTKMNDNTIDLF